MKRSSPSTAGSPKPCPTPRARAALEKAAAPAGSRRGVLTVAAVAASVAVALLTLWLAFGRSSQGTAPFLLQRSAEERSSRALSAREIGALAAPSTVSIRCGLSLGSGFFVSPERLLTNAHVLCDDDELVIVGTGSEERRGEVVARDDWLDIALIRVAKASVTPLPLGDASILEQGETVYFYGSPLGLELTLSQGIVSHPSRVLLGLTYVQIDANVTPGNSGGPLITSQGEVVGVVTMVVGEGSGLGLALPVNYLFEGDRPLLSRPSSADTAAWRDRLRTASSQDSREVARVVESLERPVLAAAFLPMGRKPFALVIRLAATKPWAESFRFELAQGAETVCYPDGESLRWESLASGDAEWLDERTRLWLERHAVEIGAWGAMVPLGWEGCPRPADALGLELVLADADPAWRRASRSTARSRSTPSRPTPSIAAGSSSAARRAPAACAAPTGCSGPSSPTRTSTRGSGPCSPRRFPVSLDRMSFTSGGTRVLYQPEGGGARSQPRALFTIR